MLVVTVGTERFPFDRLLRAVDEAAERFRGEEVFVQTGHSTYRPAHCRWARVLPYAELTERLRAARIIISHAGVGSFVSCARAGKIPILVPRRRQFGEHVDDHQVAWAARMATLGHAVLADHPEDAVSLVCNDKGLRLITRSAPSTNSELASALRSYLGGVEPHGQAPASLPVPLGRQPGAAGKHGTIERPTAWGDLPPTRWSTHHQRGPRPRPWPDGGVE